MSGQYVLGSPYSPLGSDALTLSSLSTEVRLWPVQRLLAGVPTDPTVSVVVYAAFATPGVTPTAWAQVNWEKWTVKFGPSYFVRVGFGATLDFKLTRGVYVPWFKFNDTPTTVTIAADQPIHII